MGKIIALLCWYNEPPSWLSATVASLARIGVDHVVAVDGAYALFPDGRPRSNMSESQAIQMAGDAVGIGVTVYQPTTVWMGGEPEKRSTMFKLATAHATIGEDWFFVIDADEVITQDCPHIKQELETTDALVARGRIEQWWGDHQVNEKTAHIARMMPHPTVFGSMQTRFFRVIDNMRCERTHFTYVGDVDGVSYTLRGDKHGRVQGFVQADIYTPERLVTIEHRDPLRDRTRAMDKADYYEKRDRLGIEAVPGMTADV